jgi:hypothetical protein
MGGVEPDRLTEDQRKYLSMVTSRMGKPRDASWNRDLMMETLETPSHCLHVVPFFIVHSYWRELSDNFKPSIFFNYSMQPNTAIP